MHDEQISYFCLLDISFVFAKQFSALIRYIRAYTIIKQWHYLLCLRTKPLLTYWFILSTRHSYLIKLKRAYFLWRLIWTSFTCGLAY